MNQRIQELAEQAGISLSQKNFSYYWVESAEDIEKFAQLIVRECASRCVLAPIDYILSGEAYANRIKEHFGGEE